jgi:aspartyl-tRNA(Asn)/glutamyl-tRNA(Gln) amidotransferase subunit B
MQDRYDLVIGLEVHAQLSTESKLFCGDSTAFGAEPNTQISEVSLGYPGTLPVLNKKALEFAISMGLACSCKISQTTFFDRKNYFYPDLPKGYQTTQDNAPICVGGEVPVRPKGQPNRVVRLNRIHLEEDAGKSIHEDGGKETLVDLNRAGVPLIEIVTEPEMHSSEEAYAFLYEIRKLVRYLGICDGNMEEGSLRCDANISVKPKGSTVLGSKVEIKNMNSLRFVQKAIEFEWLRQTQMLENGKIIVSETRQFNPQNGETSSLRSKETLNDYRYFPDPDLSPVLVSDEWLKEIRKSLPTLPETYYEKFTSKLGLPEQDAIFLTENKETAVCFSTGYRVKPNIQKPSQTG